MTFKGGAAGRNSARMERNLKSFIELILILLNIHDLHT